MTVNPFSASNIAAGRVPYLYDPTLTPESLLQRWTAQRFRGAIIGPHGIGKTTLAIDLARRLSGNHPVLLVTIRSRRSNLLDHCWRRLGVEAAEVLPDGELRSLDDASPLLKPSEFLDKFRVLCRQQQPIWIIDGWERLGWWHRRRWARVLRAASAKLMVTLHTDLDIGIPVFVRLEPNRRQFAELAATLQASSDLRLTDEELANAWDKCHGIPRAAFDRLYDAYEHHRRRSGGEPANLPNHHGPK